MVLAVVSAAIGAGAALWLRSPAPAESAAQLQSSKIEPPPAADAPLQLEAASPPPAAAQTAAPSGPVSSEPPEPSPAAAQAEPADLPEPAPETQAEPEAPATAAIPASPAPAGASSEPDPPAVVTHPAALTVTPRSVRQGETIVISVNSGGGGDGGGAVAVVRGPAGRWPPLTLTPYEAEFWGVLGVPRDTPPGFYPITVELRGAGGRWLQTLTGGLTVEPSTAPLEEIWLEGGGLAASPEAIQRDHDVRFVEHVAVNGPPRWRGGWIRPAAGDDSGYFGSPRMYNGVMSDQWHHGHDIAAQHGDPIAAAARGVVVWTGELVLHGLGVILDHGAGVYSGYWHMSLIAAAVGDEVEAGDWLGNIGTTGLSTGPHLHWEVIVRGVDVDPLQWLGGEHPPLPAALAEPPPDAGETIETTEAAGADAGGG